MIILGIETSCDDTSCAVMKDDKILSSIVSTQLKHQEFGGVIPEIASREHQKFIITIINQALTEAKVSLSEVDAIGVTYGPGLVGPLLVGLNTAKSLAFSNNIPVVAVNHIEAHIMANFIEHPKIELPALILVVSGGHTELIYTKDFTHYELIGKTRDDAAGECIDKVAKMMGLGFPGGRVIDQLARQGDENFHQFPIGMKDSLDFSFSGLKTAVKVFLAQHQEDFLKENINNIAASFQKSVVDALVLKLFKATKKHRVKSILLAGGVSANSRLRNTTKVKSEKYGFNFFYPSLGYCTDNGAMVASCANYKIKKYGIESFSFEKSLGLDAVPNLRLSE